jgi:hypothetical protein
VLNYSFRIMGILIDIGDVVVLLLLIISIPRMIWKDQQRSSVSLLLAIATALVLIIFATVAFVAYAQIVAESPSLLVRGALLVFLLGMGVFLRISWTSKSVA